MANLMDITESAIELAKNGNLTVILQSQDGISTEVPLTTGNDLQRDVTCFLTTQRLSIKQKEGLRNDEKWTKRETSHLIALWRAHYTQIETSVQRRPLFESMAKQLNEMGHPLRTGGIVQKKIQALRDIYRKCFHRTKRTGDAPTWLFYNSIDEFLGGAIAELYADVYPVQEDAVPETEQDTEVTITTTSDIESEVATAESFDESCLVEAFLGANRHSDESLDPQSLDAKDIPAGEVITGTENLTPEQSQTIFITPRRRLQASVEANYEQQSLEVHGRIVTLLEKLAENQAQFARDMVDLQRRTSEQFASVSASVSELLAHVTHSLPVPNESRPTMSASATLVNVNATRPHRRIGSLVSAAQKRTSANCDDDQDQYKKSRTYTID